MPTASILNLLNNSAVLLPLLLCNTEMNSRSVPRISVTIRKKRHDAMVWCTWCERVLDVRSRIRVVGILTILIVGTS